MPLASSLLIAVAVLLLVSDIQSLEKSPGSLFRRELVGHESLWKEFDTLYRAAKDLGGGNGNHKVNGLPPIMLDALAKRIGMHLPSTKIHRAGCVAAADQLVGPASRGTYDLLLPLETDGVCTAPTTTTTTPVTTTTTAATNVDQDDALFSRTMEWRNESPEHEQKYAGLPPVEKVFDAIFARKEGRARLPRPEDPSLSFWMLSFVNWFHDDNFRTVPNTDGGHTWSDRGGLHMAHLYGHTQYRHRALRIMSGGKMRTSSRLGWNHYPPLLIDVQKDFPEFIMWTPTRGSPFNSTSAGKGEEHDEEKMPFYFAMGDPRFNMHPGHIMWHSIALPSQHCLRHSCKRRRIVYR